MKENIKRLLMEWNNNIKNQLYLLLLIWEIKAKSKMVEIWNLKLIIHLIKILMNINLINHQYLNTIIIIHLTDQTMSINKRLMLIIKESKFLMNKLNTN